MSCKRITYLKALLLAGLFFSLASCEGDPFPVDTGNGNPTNRLLEVTTYHRFLTDKGIVDTLLPNTLVVLYTSLADREFAQDKFKERITGTDGTVKLEFLPADMYYARASHPNFTNDEFFEFMISDQAIVAFEEVYFSF